MHGMILAITALLAQAVQGLELRNLGGTTNSGRIADVAVDPRRHSTWWTPAITERPGGISQPSTRSRLVHLDSALQGVLNY